MSFRIWAEEFAPLVADIAQISLHVSWRSCRWVHFGEGHKHMEAIQRLYFAIARQ